MIEFKGLVELHSFLSTHEDEGWIFLDHRLEPVNADTVYDAAFIIADDEAEERQLLKRYPQFLERPTYQDVVETESAAGRNSIRDVAEGCAYYLMNDDFRD